MIDPSANFSGFPAGYNPFAAMAQAFQTMPQATPVSFPQASLPQAYMPQEALLGQMTPQQMSYGPMHSALAQSLAQALQSQMSGGLLGSPTPEEMGLLSAQITPAVARQMPISIPATQTSTGKLKRGSTPPAPPPPPAPAPTPLGPNEYYRLTANFWDTMPKTLIGSVNPYKYV